MPKRNSGPRLKWFSDRGAYYIVWTERHRSPKRSTGETDGERAQVKLAEFIAAQRRAAGPRDPNEALVTDILVDYLQERGPKVVAKERMSYAVLALCGYFEGKTVAKSTSINTLTGAPAAPVLFAASSVCSVPQSITPIGRADSPAPLQSNCLTHPLLVRDG